MERRRTSCNECGYCEGLPPSATESLDYAELSESQLREVAGHVLKRVKERLAGARTRFIPVAVSARHVHLTQEVLDTLYGKGHTLTPFRELSQPGEFAAKEAVTIIGKRMRSIEDVRILGPIRNYTQVELSRTDGVALGLELPVRDSGQLEGTSPIVIVGPKGAVSLKEGAIRPKRHIHASVTDAELLGLRSGQTVSVRVPGEKGVIFENVTVKTHPSYVLEMHLDTDDANAADVYCDMLVEILDS